MTAFEIVALITIAIGVFFTLVSSIGLVRLPDLYTRVHAAGKSGTLGIVGVLLGVGIYYIGQQNFPIVLRMLALIAFFFLTAPVAAHMLDRAAFLTGVKPMEGTQPNDLVGRYDQETRRLS
jgi:multicomponent Na+:H+ antiporter subunit G